LSVSRNSLKLRYGLPVLFALASCAQPVPYERESSQPPQLAQEYVRLAEEGAAVYAIDPATSLLLVHVGKAGRMAQLGHEHAVVSTDLQGFIALAVDPEASRADIFMPLVSLAVDDPEYRSRLALETEISEADRAGTYTNMRKTLDAESFPWVHATAKYASLPSQPPEISLSITLHGVAIEYLVPVRIEITPERLTARGELVVVQSDFGLTPYSAVGGLLKVADALQVEIELVALRVRA